MAASLLLASPVEITTRLSLTRDPIDHVGATQPTFVSLPRVRRALGSALADLRVLLPAGLHHPVRAARAPPSTPARASRDFASLGVSFFLAMGGILSPSTQEVFLVMLLTSHVALPRVHRALDTDPPSLPSVDPFQATLRVLRRIRCARELGVHRPLHPVRASVLELALTLLSLAAATSNTLARIEPFLAVTTATSGPESGV